MEKFQKNYQIAAKSLQIADHMAYITYPLINEKRLLLKIFDEIYKSVINSIYATLNYEKTQNRVVVYDDDFSNLEIFYRICEKYGFSKDKIKFVSEILELNKKHKQSAIEFVRKEKVVILSDNLSTIAIDIKKIKEYLIIARELVIKTGYLASKQA
ncbi:MAG: hypothetical protein ACP5OG_00155 [Candidatus Nanoarchaeia archaeon]